MDQNNLDGAEQNLGILDWANINNNRKEEYA